MSTEEDLSCSAECGLGRRSNPITTSPAEEQHEQGIFRAGSLHRRSASAAAVLESGGIPDSDSYCSMSVLGSTASLSSAATCNMPVVDLHRHQHRHKHKHHHHHHHKTLQAGDRSRSVSADDLPSTHNGSSNSSSAANLIAVVEDRRPRSFTAGQGVTRMHHSSSHSGQPFSPTTNSHHMHHNNSHIFATGMPRPKHNHGNKQHGSSSCGSSAVSMPHVVGRRPSSPLQHSMHSKQQGLGGFAGGHGAGHAVHAAAAAGAGSAAGAACALLGLPVVPKPERVMAESVKPELIAKGFAAHFFSKRMLDVFSGSWPSAAAVGLVRQVPSCPGLHLWVVKPPRCRQWVPVHLGSTDNLQQAIGTYLHADGSVGPTGEPFKYRVIMDLMCRGFAIQVRFRPAKTSKFSSAKEDELSKLRVFDFPLNDKDNGGCRPIELPNGWQVVEYPVVLQEVDRLYEQLFGPR